MKNHQQITQILYQIDPMGTCCVENDATDEYESVARIIMTEGVKSAFYNSFWEGCISDETIQSIEAAIE